MSETTGSKINPSISSASPLEAIDHVISEWHLLKHPFYQDWMAGKLESATLKDYATQYYHHVDAFPGYLSATLAKCQQDDARNLIAENLAEENGETFGMPHPEMWLQFAEGMGAQRETVKGSSPRAAIKNVIVTFQQLTQSSYAEGLGAIYTYESQIPEIAESKIQGLRERYGIHDARTLTFFEVHRLADVAHREVLKTLLEQLAPAEKNVAAVAARKTAVALWDFLSDVQACRATTGTLAHAPHVAH